MDPDSLNHISSEPSLLIKIIPTMVGAFLASLFGILSFHYQKRHEDDKRNSEAMRRALDALRRLADAAAANLDSLANAKLRFGSGLAKECMEMEKITEDAAESGGEERAAVLERARPTINQLEHFFSVEPPLSFFNPPDAKEYSILSDKMPGLSQFALRASGMTSELAHMLDSRNALLTDWSKEGGPTGGMPPERHLHHWRMLYSSGRVASSQIDNGLYFWHLVFKQVEFYMTNVASDKPQPDFELAPQVLAALPTGIKFPSLEKKLVKFEK